MKFLRLFLIAIFLLAVSGGYSWAQILPPPDYLFVKSGELGGAMLNWDTTTGAAGYVVYKSADGGPFNRIAAVPRSVFVDWWVFPDHLYSYYVTAFRMVDSTLEESVPSPSATFALGLHHLPLPGQGVIGGRVLDEMSGLPIRGAVVRIYRPGRLWSEKTHTDSGGIYWATLDTGKYILRADKYDYFGEWFDNALHLDSVTYVEVHEDSLEVANFALRHIPVPEYVTVAGTVTDSMTGLPLGQTFVAFMRPHRWLRDLQAVTGLFGGLQSECFDIPGLGRLFGVVWAGKTDANGAYQARLLKGVKYISFAFKPGYIPEFFNDKFIPLTADRLRFTGDSAGIDYKLLPNPLATNLMSGSVVDSIGTGVPSHVILYRETVLGRVPVRFGLTDSLGNFEFKQLSDGRFFMRAFPVDEFSPAWYSSDDCGVRNWRHADTVLITSSVTGLEICVKPVGRLGFGRIAGFLHRNGSNLSGSAVEQGATVYAVSQDDGRIAGYDITEDDGSFSIENLPEGAYMITADKEGFSATSEPVFAIEPMNNFEVSDAEVTLAADPTSVKDDKPSVPAVFRLYQNYPNPFNPTTQIRFDLPKSSSVVLKVFNLIGQEVELLINRDLPAGTHTAKWNALQSGTGIYFFKMTAIASDGERFSEVRKMIYLK